MERQNESELRELLREWKVGDAPASLESRVLASRHAWWHVLIHGYIKVPVPVACGLVILTMVGAWRLTAHTSTGCRSESVFPAAVAGPRVSATVSKAPAQMACAGNSTC
jgi:hypothetical protein